VQSEKYMEHFMGGEATYRAGSKSPGNYYRTFTQLQGYVQQLIDMKHFRSRNTLSLS
jgi:hypothetical protein